MQLGKPIQLRGKLLFQHEVVVIVPTESTTKKKDKLIRQRHDRILQRMLFFFRCNAPVASQPLATADTSVRWHQCGGDPHLAAPPSTPPASPGRGTPLAADVRRWET